MVGPALKKYAKENGLSVASGLCYGVLHGFQISATDGSNIKTFIINTKFPDVEKLNALQAALNGANIQKQYNVAQVSFAPDGVVVVFTDVPGTMKKIRAFMDWFLPLLAEAEAFGADICPACGQSMGGTGVWKNTSGVARCYHRACADRLAWEISEENEAADLQDTGTYASGAVGAVLGALLGGVIWGIVLFSGWLIGILGALIAFLAEKGYNLLHGRQDKGKVVILIVAVIIGVVFGTLVGTTLECVELLNEITDQWGVSELVELVQLVLADSEAQGAIVSNLLQGLFFAALCTVYFFIAAAKKVEKPKVSDLP